MVRYQAEPHVAEEIGATGCLIRVLA